MKIINKLTSLFRKSKQPVVEEKSKESTLAEFLDTRGYDKDTDILIANPNDYVQKNFLQNTYMDLGPVIKMNVQRPAIIRFGYSGNKGRLW